MNVLIIIQFIKLSGLVGNNSKGGKSKIFIFSDIAATLSVRVKQTIS